MGLRVPRAVGTATVTAEDSHIEPARARRGGARGTSRPPAHRGLDGREYLVAKLEVAVPAALVPWVAAQMEVSEAQALDVVLEAVRLQACLGTKSAEVLDPQTDPLLVFVSNFASPPREGSRWFDCGAARPRRMLNGRAIDDGGR